MNWISGDICNAGGGGGRETPFASSPCFSPKHRNSVPQHRPLQMLPGTLLRHVFGDLWLCRYSMLFHKAQPSLSGTARGQWNGLSPCTPVTKLVEKTDHNDFSIPTYKYICVCICADIPGCMYTDTQVKTAYLMRLRCLWIYAG